MKYADSIPPEVPLDCGLILVDRLYVRMPLRCRNCLIYGYHEDSCPSPSKHCTCYVKPEHRSRLHPNCSGPQQVNLPRCPAYVREVKAKRLRITERNSREKALSRTPLLGPQFYSQAAAQAVKTLLLLLLCFHLFLVQKSAIQYPAAISYIGTVGFYLHSEFSFILVLVGCARLFC